MSEPMRIFATVGTDHHPFTRLVRWLDEFAQSHAGTVEVVVQHGHTPAPRVAQGRDFLGYDELEGMLQSADVVVCHGGPGTIVDAQRLGHLPICVPRDPAYGEHVDGHQLRFASLLGEQGRVELCREQEQLFASLERHVARDGLGPRHRDVEPMTEGVWALGRELDLLLVADRPRRRTTVLRFIGSLSL